MRSTRARRAWSICVVALMTLACNRPASAIDEAEQRERIEFQVRTVEHELEIGGHLYGDAAIDAYLQSVLDRLFPENQGRYRIRAYRDSEFNAFAVATGNLYVNIGALLRVRDEAELAAVLGHEGGHVLKDHTYRQVRSSKAMGVVGTILSAGLIAGIGIDPGIGAIASYSSMAGFSRDYERESDRVGFERSIAAGYDPRAGARIFDRMAREMETRKIDHGPYFFASHPRLKERVESFNALARDAPEGVTRRDEYVAATEAARRAALDMLVAGKNGLELVFVLTQDDLASELPPTGVFALGEGYRLRNLPGDEDLAAAQYRKSIEQFPDFAPAWGALGRLDARHGDKAAAITHLERFLALAPDAQEAPFARQTLDRLRNEVTP